MLCLLPCLHAAETKPPFTIYYSLGFTFGNRQSGNKSMWFGQLCLWDFGPRRKDHDALRFYRGEEKDGVVGLGDLEDRG